MRKAVWSVAWYRFRATLRRRRSGYVAIVLLIGLVGGLSLGSIAAARRTQSSFPVYAASTDPTQIQTFDAFLDPAIGDTSGYNAATAHAMARLPHVKAAYSIVGFDANITLLSHLHTHAVPGAKPPVFEGSPDGEFVRADRVTLAVGRMANPRRQDEVVMNAQAASQLGLHIGSTVRLGFNSDAQLLSPTCCTLKADPPPVIVTLRLVGIIVAAPTVVEDDSDALGSQLALFTPALTRRIEGCCSTYSSTALVLDGGSREVGRVQAESAAVIGQRALAAGGQVSAGGPSLKNVTATAERSIRPEAIATGVFGGIAGLGALLIALQIIGRQLRLSAGDRGVLRALGASPPMTVADGLIGVLGSVVVGSLLAVGVAVGLSPLAPFGPVRPVYPTPGVAFDWTVFSFGMLTLVLVLGALSVALAYRNAPHRASRRQDVPTRGSVAVGAAAAGGLPVSAVAGIRFALEPGRGRNTVPVRSAILGAVLALTVVTGAFTFGSSLDTLVSHPALYGWNWNDMLLSAFSGDEDLPQHETSTLLAHDHFVAASTGVYFGSLHIDGQRVPVLGTTASASVQPPLLSGHGFDGTSQVVLGASTIAALHKHVGDTVEVSNGVSAPVHLLIVGTATMPAIGTEKQHLEMGTGAVLSYRLIPATARNLQQDPIPGPNSFFIRLRPGVNQAQALRSLQKINRTLGNSPDGNGGLVGVLRPAEIANYRSIGTVPALLGGALSLGAVVALGLTLVASVRRRRHDLALLKTLGFTQRQLAATVSWQSTVAVAIGAVIGVPLGIILGRTLWNLFARNIHAVPVPSVPTLSIALIAIGALVLANVVAAIPGRLAARTPTALALRAE